MQKIAVPENRLELPESDITYSSLKPSMKPYTAQAIADFAFPDQPDLRAACSQFLNCGKVHQR